MILNKTLNTLVAFQFVVLSSSAVARDSTRHHLLVKTNLLNVPALPSVHAEFQLAYRWSVQVNFHRAKCRCFNEKQLQVLSSNIEARYYLSSEKPGKLTGLYTSLGVGIFHDYKVQKLKNPFVWEFYEVDEISLVLPIVRLGIQIKSKNSRWYGDAGFGYAYLAKPFQFNEQYVANWQPRGTIALGYRLL
jgi:hypothetical protein